MNDHYYGYPDESRRGFWDNLHPSIKAAVIVWLGVLVLQIVNVVTVGLSLVVSYPVQLLIYVGNGALAAYFADEGSYAQSDLVRTGAVAGAGLIVLTWIVYVVRIFILGVATLGVGRTGLLSCVICGPADVVVSVLCGILGAWLVKQFWAHGEPGFDSSKADR